MKKMNFFLPVGFILLSSVILFSSCKKKSTEPEPVPAPTFLMSSIPDPANANNIIFEFKCTTNDVKLTKVVITDPLASGSDTYDLQGAIALQNQIYTFTTPYLKATGKWTFVFTGNRTNDNSGFTSTSYLTVAK